MPRTQYASTMLRWLGYTARDRLERDFVTCHPSWQVTAEGEEDVIIARAPTRTEAWFEACRMAEWLVSQD